MFRLTTLGLWDSLFYVQNRWLASLFILLTASAVLASSPFPGGEAGSTPLSVPVDEEAAGSGSEKDIDDSSDSCLFVSLASAVAASLLTHGASGDDAPAIDVLHDRRFGTRGPPALRSL